MSQVPPTQSATPTYTRRYEELPFPSLTHEGFIGNGNRYAVQRLDSANAPRAYYIGYQILCIDPALQDGALFYIWHANNMQQAYIHRRLYTNSPNCQRPLAHKVRATIASANPAKLVGHSKTFDQIKNLEFGSYGT